MNVVAIHIMRRKLGLSDRRYRNILRQVAGVTSSKELSGDAAKKVYSTLCKLSEAATPAARYIWVLWTELQGFLPPKDRSGSYLVGFIRKCCPPQDTLELRDLGDLDDLDPKTVHKIIESLKIRLSTEEEKLAKEVPF